MQLSNGLVIDNLFNFDVKDYWDEKVVAHSLALQNRYTGHSRFGISVAQHLLLTSELALLDTQSHDIVLACHLHDASESYMSDLNKCLKILPELENYRIRENFIEYEIFRLHGIEITKNLLEKVKYYDNMALSTEAYWVMDITHPVWKEHINTYPPRKDILIQEENWKEVKQEWLDRYSYLTEPVSF